MPRSMYTRSAATRSARSCSSASAKLARMKRVRHGASSASAAKRSSAAGSRSTAISVPSGPRRPATSRAWPPPPKVQSTATSPGCGSTTLISSPARTGTWVAVMSSRMAKAGGDVGKVMRKRLVVVGPCGAVPALEAVARARHDDLLAQPPVVEQEAGHHHAPRGVELRVERVRGEEAAQLARRLRERVHPGERRLHVAVVGRRRPDLHAALDPLRQHHAIRQRRPELRRNRQPVLRVEGVVEGAAEGHRSSRLPRVVVGAQLEVPRREPDAPDRGRPARELGRGPRWRSGRSPSTPVRCDTSTPQPPTSQLDMHILSHRRTPSDVWTARFPVAMGISRRNDRPRGTPRFRKRRCRRPRCTGPCSATDGSVRPLCLRGGAPWEARGYDASAMSSALRRPAVLLLVALAAVASGVAGCASAGGSGGATDPAALVPSSAPLYAEAVLAGGGQEQADAQAALGRILRTSDPRGELARLFDRGNANFARDVEPWLGDRVGAAALAFGGRNADHVVVADSRDDAQADAALGRLLPNAQRRSYRGVDYRVATGRRGFAAAVVEHAVVLGTENGLKAAIDASKGESLAGTNALKQAREKVRQERSAFLYVDVAGVLRGALSAAGGQAAQLAPLVEPIAQALPKTIAAALHVQADRLRLDSSALRRGLR